MNKPIWEPGEERIERANINRFIRFVRERPDNEDIRRYAPLYDFSVRHPENSGSSYGNSAASAPRAISTRSLVDGDKMPGAKWFPNVRLNFAQNLLRYKDDRVAIVARNEWGHKRELLTPNCTTKSAALRTR